MSDIPAETAPIHVTIALRLLLETPLSVGASGSQGGLADKSIQRDGWNRPLIPGSQLKGRVRHYCERLARSLGCTLCEAPFPDRMCPDDSRVTRKAVSALDRHRGTMHLGARSNEDPPPQCPTCALFGSPTYPAPLRFGDLVHTPPSLQPDTGGDGFPGAVFEFDGALRTGVGIDRRRRTAQEKVLYVVETTSAGLLFEGEIWGTWRGVPLAELRPLLGLLLGGIQLTRRWGGGSSRGLGWAVVEAPSVTVGGSTVPSAELIEEVRALCPQKS